MPNSRPRIEFNKDGICNACTNYVEKKNINWAERKELFLNKINEIKKNSYQIEKNDLDIIQKDFLSESCNEKETIGIIKKVYEENDLIIDPHTAVGVGAASKLSFNDCVVLSTAHPCKFPDAVFNSIGIKPRLPEKSLQVLRSQNH